MCLQIQTGRNSASIEIIYSFAKGKGIVSQQTFIYLQNMRAMAMKSKRRERYREYLAGLRDYDTVYIKNEHPGVWQDPAPNPKDKFGFKVNTD